MMHLAAEDGDLRWPAQAKLDVISANLEYGQLDLPADHQPLAAFALENQHGLVSSGKIVLPANR